MSVNLKTNRHGGRLVVLVSYDGGATYEPERYCGESWCDGDDCEHPALFLRVVDTELGPMELKAHSSMVAVGHVWQAKPWKGRRVYVPEEAVTERTRGMMWW